MRHVSWLYVTGAVVVQTAQAQTVYIEPVASTGQPSSFGSPYFYARGSLLDPNERLTFAARIEGVGDVIEQWTIVGLSNIVANGDPAPGTEPDTVFKSDQTGGGPFKNFTANTSGVAFAGHLDGPSVDTPNDRGIWFYTPRSQHLVAREGDHPAGTEPTTTFDELTSGWSVELPQLNHFGQIVFTGELVGPDVPPGAEYGIWRWENGVQSLLLRSGTPAPGTGTTFAFFTEPQVSDTGLVVFAGDLDFASPLFEGIWALHEGGITPVALLGESVPGREGLTFAEISNQPLVSSNGVIVFWADVDGPGVTGENNRTLWAVEDGEYRLVAREGDLAPDTTDTTVFGVMNVATLNPHGRCVLFASLSGPDVTSSNNTGMWVETSDGLRLVVREGPDNSGSLATFTVAHFAPFSTGATVAMNSSQRVVFHVDVVEPGESAALALITWSPGSDLLAIALPNTTLPDSSGADHVISKAYISSTQAGVNLFESRRALTDSGHLTFNATFKAGGSGVYRALIVNDCPWDLTGDGMVNVHDLQEVVHNFGPCDKGDCPADFNGDGIVNARDLVELVHHFGPCP